MCEAPSTKLTWKRKAFRLTWILPACYKSRAFKNRNTNLTIDNLSSSALACRRKVAWRLLPFLFAAYIVAYLDRANVSFANVYMSADLHFSPAVYGFGAGVFFWVISCWKFPER